MNKSDLIDSVAASASLTKADAGKVVDALLNSIIKSLHKGEDVVIVGFGSFSVKRRAARTGRNPQTGQTVNIPAANQPKFKAGKGLKEAVN